MTATPCKSSSTPVVRSATKSSSHPDASTNTDLSASLFAIATTDADKSVLVEEGEGRVAEDCGDIGKEGRPLGAVGEPVVERDRQSRHPAWLNPLLRSLVHHPGSATDLAEAENAGLPWVQDRGTRVDTKYPDVGDSERAARHVRGLSLSLTRRCYRLSKGSCQLGQVERLGALDVRHQETTWRGSCDP